MTVSFVGILLITSFSSLLAFAGGSPGPKTAPSVDWEFIEKSLGSSVFLQDTGLSADLPNCVATALRAGKFLPAFALAGTDSFYATDLPACFRQKSSFEKPRQGDLGILYFPGLRKLAHAALFLDTENVFEKASPQNRDAFNVTTWAQSISAMPVQGSGLDIEVWEFTGGRDCSLNVVTEKFMALPKDHVVRVAAQEIEDRISANDWTSPSTRLTRERLEQALREIRRSQNFDRWNQFQEQIIDLLLQAPAFQTRVTHSI